MEKKSIGGFIAALRKANGMTQKDLAERLNVSDKTVSRWERDEGSPDLSVIPVIAEIFDITCDELLRGERKSPTQRSEIAEEPETSAKGEKQLKRLVKSTLSQYQSLTYIAMGVSVVGLLAALICNLAFLKAVLGFLVGAIFFAASIVCQAIFMNKAFLSVEDAGLDTMALSDYKRKVIVLAEKSIGLTVFFIGFTFPLVLVDAYVGLGADSLLIWGIIGATPFLMLYATILYFLNTALLKRGVYTLSDEELTIYTHNRKLKKKCSVVLVLTLVITLLLHIIGGELIWSAYNLSLSKGIVFDDYESFIEYMEQDIPYDSGHYYNVWLSGADEHPITQAPESTANHQAIEWYDKDGNIISEEEALTRTLEDANGNVVCTYVARNNSVSSIRYAAKDGTVLPIKVITVNDFRAAAGLSNMITTLYCALYPIELLIVLLIYFKKRAK